MSGATVLADPVRAAAVLLSMVRECVWQPSRPGLGFLCACLQWHTQAGEVAVLAQVEPADLVLWVGYRNLWRERNEIRGRFFADPADAVGFIEAELFHEGCGSAPPPSPPALQDLHRIDLGQGRGLTFRPCPNPPAVGHCRCGTHWQ